MMAAWRWSLHTDLGNGGNGAASADAVAPIAELLEPLFTFRFLELLLVLDPLLLFFFFFLRWR